jgi:hypothetical protein
MRNKRMSSSLQRKRQLNRQHAKVINRRQEYFVQTLLEEKLCQS